MQRKTTTPEEFALLGVPEMTDTSHFGVKIPLHLKRQLDVVLSRSGQTQKDWLLERIQETLDDDRSTTILRRLTPAQEAALRTLGRGGRP